MKKFFLMDFWGDNRLTVNTTNAKEAQKRFFDIFGYPADVVKLIDRDGGTIKILKGFKGA